MNTDKGSISDRIHCVVKLTISFELRTGGPDTEDEIQSYIAAGIGAFERDAYCEIGSHSVVRL